tara:strand:- start:5763 stop:6272 length:510 start_codon:yes stop_codon:yes gene_type:complete
MITLNTLIQKLAKTIHKDYTISMNGTSNLVVPEVNITDAELLSILQSNEEIQLYFNKHHALFKVSKNIFEDIFPSDVKKYIIQYIPMVTKQMLSYCRWWLYEQTEVQLIQVINENQFDMIWYAYGSRDYNWAKDTIHEAKVHLKEHQTKKKTFLKQSKYKIPYNPVLFI